MEVLEENLFDDKNYDILCQLIDKEIGNTHPEWRIDFVIVDISNGSTIVNMEDMSKVLNGYKDNDSSSPSSVMFKLKSLVGKRVLKKKDQYDAKTEYENLKMCQDCWADENGLSCDIINCDKELDFICSNLQNIRDRERILVEECKENLSNEKGEIINSENKLAMEKRFDHLLKSMEMEGHYHGSNVYDSIYDAKRNALQLRWQEALTKTKSVLSELRPFDIKKMLSLYDKTAAAAEETKGKDLCLLLGHTGMVFALTRLTI